MEFDILYAIQSLRTDSLDAFMLKVTELAGNMGELWLIVGFALILFKQTRKIGFGVLVSYCLVYAIGQCGLKELIGRVRPCRIDETVNMIVSCPSSFSCPSTHSSWAFASATVIYRNDKFAGIMTYIVAAIIAFSRMYDFVHFPTDILFGAVLGVLCGLVAYWLVKKVYSFFK